MSPALSELFARYPSVATTVDAVVEAWPQHEAFATKHFSNADAAYLAFVDTLAARALKLIGTALPRYAADYRWMCNLFLKHELRYRREQSVQYTRFEDIRAHYYDNAEDMGRYMRGLMISQVLWRQHAGAAAFFAKNFLPGLPDDYDYLEIGPGHGLWLSFAATDPRCRSLAGFDVSEASLALTREGLATMGIHRDIDLRLQDICAGEMAPIAFDAICISQVLELVSSPQAAVDRLGAWLKPGGRLFINAPTRLIAPDHLRVWKDGEVAGLVAHAGLEVVEEDRIVPDATRATADQGFSHVLIAWKP